VTLHVGAVVVIDAFAQNRVQRAGASIGCSTWSSVGGVSVGG
jgi:hypothetical protein